MGKYFEFYNPTKINCGKSALSTISTELEYFGSVHPMVLASQNATRMGALDKVVAAMKGRAVKASVVVDSLPNKPDVEILRDVKKKFVEGGCDGIVAVGGESVMDSAKALKLFLAENCDDLLPLVGISKKPISEIPLVMVPTECGSGHETSGFIEVEDKYVSSAGIIPNAVVIDEEVTAIAPARVTAASGVYALANAIEAFLGADDITIIEIYAETAVKLTFEHLLRVVKDEETADDCVGLALASAYGGIAYGNVPFGAAHALAEAISDVCGEPVEEAITIALLSLLKNLSPAQEKKLAQLLPYTCSLNEVSETPESERLHKTIENVEKLIASLNAECGIPTKISQTKIQRESFGAIALAAQDKRSAITGLSPIGQEAFLKLLNDAY